MVELGQLERNHEEFAKRGIRVYAVSNDNESDAKEVQTKFPHLIIVSDAEQNVANAMKVTDPGNGPDGTATNAPATFLVDGTGNIRWLYHADRFTDRLAPGQLLNVIDETWSKSK
jgi:peroxiredoxin